MCGQREHGDRHGLNGDHEYQDPSKAGLAPMSKGRQAYLRQREGVKWAGQICAIQLPNVCTVKAEGEHHVMPRGVAGGLEAADRYPKVPACSACNSAVQATVKGRKWAKERGLLLSYEDLKRGPDAAP